MSDTRRTTAERAVIDRLQKLRVVLPAMAQEAAEARREAARLRAENSRLVHRLAQLESRYGAGLSVNGAPMQEVLRERGRRDRGVA